MYRPSTCTYKTVGQTLQSGRLAPFLAQGISHAERSGSSGSLGSQSRWRPLFMIVSSASGGWWLPETVTVQYGVGDGASVMVFRFSTPQICLLLYFLFLGFWVFER